MGGVGSGRPTKEMALVKAITQPQHPIGEMSESPTGSFFLPNTGGAGDNPLNWKTLFKLDQTTPQEINCGNGTIINVGNGSLDLIEYFPVIQGTTNLTNDGVAFTSLIVPRIIFYNGTTGSTNIFTVGDNGLVTLGGMDCTVEDADADTGLKEVATFRGNLFGGGSAGDETSVIFRAGAGHGALSGSRRLGAVSGVIDKKETGAGADDWEGGLILNVFEGSTYPTPQEAVHIYKDKTVKFFGGIKTSDGSTGWTGSFTNGDGDTVTVKNGIITDVS